MKRGEELTVIGKTYDFILWSCNHTSRFPRNHRFVLGERIEGNLYGLLETLIQAKYTRRPDALLQQANLNLEVVGRQARRPRRALLQPHAAVTAEGGMTSASLLAT